MDHKKEAIQRPDKIVQFSNGSGFGMPTVNSSKSMLAGLSDRAKAMEMKDQVGTYDLTMKDRVVSAF